jgi:hypothetical protein
VKKSPQSPCNEVNLLELVPIRTMKWEADEDGLVTLLQPKFRNKVLIQHLIPRMKKPYFKIKLDDIGSHFWTHCDGRRSIREIAELQEQKFGEKAEPLYERISQFLQTLQRNRFITLKS